MILRTLMIWTLGATALAYTPSAPEILSKMAVTLRRAQPVEVRVKREIPDVEVVEELLLVVPGRPGSTEKLQTVADLPYPYALLTLPAEELASVLPAVASEKATVALGRLDGKVCYILVGSDARMWISKVDLLPLKIEVAPDGSPVNTYLYLDMIDLSEKVRYPSRTEVWRDDELILVERMIPATASTDTP